MERRATRVDRPAGGDTIAAAARLECVVGVKTDSMRLVVALPSTPSTAEKLVEALRFLMSTTRLEPGCLGCAVWTDADSTVHYTEEWESEAEMRRRVRSDKFTSLLAVIESAQKPPEVQFELVTSTRGLDYVRDARRDILPD